MIGLGSVLFQYSGKGGGHISKFYLNDCMLKFELCRSRSILYAWQQCWYFLLKNSDDFVNIRADVKLLQLYSPF